MYRNVLIATDRLPTSAPALREGPRTLGSVAQQVVRMAGGPALVVPARG